MDQIKVFNGSSESDINKWIQETSIEVVEIQRRDVTDTFSDGIFTQTWTETVIRYKVPSQFTISIIWDLNDIEQVRPDLTEEEGKRVLIEVKENHDANVGVNWEILKVTADDMYPISKV